MTSASAVRVAAVGLLSSLAACAGVCWAYVWLARRRLRPRLKLTYFDIAGLGEQLRLGLALAQIPFEDERLPSAAEGYAEVTRRRAAGLLPFGQLPTLQVDGRVYAQSNALLRYVGRLGGLYPDGVEGLHCDMVLEAWADVDARLAPQHYKCALPRSPIDGIPQVPLSAEQQSQVARHLNDDALPIMLGRIARVLASSPGPWFCGHMLTIADVKSYVVVNGLADGSYASGIHARVLDSCPELRDHAQRVAALPAIQRWLASVE